MSCVGRFHYRFTTTGAVLAAILVIGNALPAAEFEPLHLPSAGQSANDSPAPFYEPAADCPSCFPGTLFQWSRNPSFEGGPPPRDEPLASDRPDFTESSATVGRGVVQLEMGYTYIFDEEAGMAMRSHSYPEMLWRVGILAEWLEFRIAYNHGNVETTNGPLPIANFSGAEDLYLGFKIALTPQDGWLPEMALMPQMMVPTGHDAFTDDAVLPGVNWLYGWDINDFLCTGGSTQINKAIDGTGDAYYELAQSWTVGYSLAEKVGAYTEWFALFPSGAADVVPVHYFDCGLTYSWSNDLQFDVRYGIGLNAAADDYFVGTGFVRRF